MTSQDSDLAARYGAPRPGRRRALQVTLVVLGFGALAWLIWALTAHANPSISSKLNTWEIIDEHTATITASVRMSEDIRDPRCLVRAVAADKSVVGELTFTPEIAELTTVGQTIRTERRATTVILVGCTAEGQTTPR